MESFNGKLRNELINRDIFTTLVGVSISIEEWRKKCYQVRPHSALNHRAPLIKAIIPTQKMRCIGKTQVL